jgi:ABC-type branched-subunit amino acid transport system substrate-binding protein
LLRVYAKFQLCLIILFSISLLSGCGGGYYSPFGSSINTGVVTDNPNSIPNIGWQTQGQRQVLSDQNAAQTPAGNAAAIPPVATEAVPTAQHEKIIVSILLPLSGAKSSLGQSMLKAAQMALFDIGSANFELVPRDTKSTKDGTVAAAQAALDAHSALILGPVFADDLRAIKPIVNPTHTPIISFTTDWTLAGSDTYIMGFLPFTQVMRVVKYAEEHGHSRIAVFAPQTEYSDVVISTLQKSGVPVTHISRYPAKQVDLTPAVQDLVKGGSSGDALNFDTLMLPMGSEGLRSLVTTLSNNGINQGKVKFIGTGLWDDPSLLGNPALFGGWFSAPDPDMRVDFEKRYQDNYETVPLRLSSLAYDATALAAVLARSATDAASAYSASAITNPRGFAGIDGIFRFRPDGLSERGLAVLEIRSGKAKVVDPAPTAFISSGT